MKIEGGGKSLSFKTQKEYEDWQARKTIAGYERGRIPHRPWIGREWDRLVAPFVETYWTVLDIGARDAALAVFLEESGWQGEICCCDIQKPHLRVMKRVRETGGFLFDIQKADHGTMSQFSDGQFNISVSRHTLEHCRHVPSTAKELMRVTSDILWVTVPIGQEIDVDRDKETHCYRFDNPMEVSNLFVKEFETVKQEWSGGKKSQYSWVGKRK